MLKVHQLAKSFGGQILFNEISWTLGGSDRVGLVGANGSGKSTLLRILLGQIEPDNGTVDRPAAGSMGYLAQNDFTLTSGLEGTPEEEAWSAFPEICDIEKRLDELRRDEGGDAQEEMDLIHRRQILEVDDVTSRISRTLAGLGFRQEEIRRPLHTFSHGWQMRAALARLLLMEPSLLLLDEPTNHLDLESREWLAEFLGAFKGSLVVVSHDRDFLDQTVTRITEILGGGLEDYRGGYSDYEQQKVERHALRWKAYKRQTEEIKRTRDWIARYHAQKRLASRVQSRIRMLEKMERLPSPEAPPPEMKARFPDPSPTPRLICRLTGIKKSYGEKKVLDHLDLELHRGDRLAIVGSNGVGKSTLLRILCGRESIQEGKIHMAPEVSLGLFSHDQIQAWDRSTTVLEMAVHTKPDEATQRLRTLLGAFLFRKDDVDKPIGALSGGERSRLALACLLLKAPNLLVLDEPTNHLDLVSIEALLKALEEYAGTIIFVAHDRYFLKRLATKVAWPLDGRFQIYPGRYEEYLWARRNRPQSFEAGGEEASDPAPVPDEDAGQPGREAAAEAPAPPDPRSEAKQRQRLATRRAKRLKELEGKIQELEERKRRYEEAFARPDFFDDADRSRPYLESHKETVAALEKLFEEWIEIENEEIDEPRDERG
ncbi:MAG: ABC-F family ATP-binding cassette domain-containing protein [Candidatus Eisenbacteria bacterium]|uniref:ABC-F family ATP-binding cassette domain-containing protein n=1 Tax=Eiseniibacteriota bacterium TaxID=2212470 RepID=A0A948W956_UNCEI|nr:ABC-F family ATP-binding cassette domain-containing protein [Candidatus Eisenbacteria bacterium]MBU1947960.1 ABC-F family ATP-binding cassette domain-containing protein [Candidatus Eisenbacteria bacterium]MBU2693416.1 ABC-F family ATP-binding cassette domain-containing protein [Candidatus Eisenbacteria bacterium]